MNFTAVMARVGFCVFLFSAGSTMADADQRFNQGFIAAEGGDYKAAVAQWEPLAQQGHALAQFNMALLYHSGAGVDIDEAKAVSWYMRAADNGYPIAQEYLAVGYQEGWFGLPKDEKQAQYWQHRLQSNAQ